MIRRPLLACALACSVVAAAQADTLKFHATLAGASEQPATDSPGRGVATASLDTATRQLTWDLTFSGFTTAVTMAHFHGPAVPSMNAKVQLPLGDKPASPLHGTATLTDEQVQQLVSGQWYANVHTADHPGGAIRGQLVQGN